ncbi:MAG: Na+/glucose cotransporter [Ignavibacteria bacterium]|nr:MAG: Na+/glucose cotransporter [Ignavibacteria bacterium]KAF0158993.1 MAG: Na+/glucose cotransporter [Ignavibacteria bacterium]
MQTPIAFVDGIIILIYVVAVLALGLYTRNSDKNLTDYFLAGRKLGWFAIGISLFATNISSEHFIGLAGGGASRGLAVAQFELIAIFFLIILGWFIAPVFRNSAIFTTPEFLEKRFDSSNRKFFSALSIFTYIITKILVTLFAGGILFNKIFGWSIFTSSIIIILLTGVYTLVGGFSAVIRTQVFQGILLLIGAFLLTAFGLSEVGGFAGLRERLPAEHFQMFKAIDDPDFPWTGILFGAPIIAFWYWCADHYMVQRILGAKTTEDARTGTLITSFLKILPLFILVLPGLIAAALFPEIRGDEAYPVLISSDILPTGIKGLVITGFLAAVMSSLSAAFNSVAALYTIDFYKPKHPGASDRTLVLVGRMATIAVIFVVILLVPFIKLMDSHIYLFLQSTQAFISAPIAAVFLFGFTLKKLNAKSVLIAFVLGEFLGISRFIIEFLVKSGMITNPAAVSFIKINYLHFTIFLFVFTSSVMLLLSYVFRYGEELAASQISFISNSESSILRFSKGKMHVLLSFFILILTLSLWYLFV